jgi:hypothetical protein
VSYNQRQDGIDASQRPVRAPRQVQQQHVQQRRSMTSSFF